MNMKEHFKVMLMTFALATVAVVITACTNPRPITSPDSSQEDTRHSGFCETYKMQEIEASDSNDERLKKLRENTFFQGQCS